MLADGAFDNEEFWDILGSDVYGRSFLSMKSMNMLPQLMHSANDGNITLTMENIARSLTNQIRSGPQTMDHLGTVYRTEVYMKVQWQWLAYPATLLFLVCMMSDMCRIER